MQVISPQLMLPSFLVVGAAKSATTSLYAYLGQHPEVFMSPLKEPHFFAFPEGPPSFSGPYDARAMRMLCRSRRAYEQLFAGRNGEKAAGECSCSYLYFEAAARTIRRYIPDCRIVVVLRNPVERAFSHYLMHVMLGMEPLGFEEALAAWPERERAGWRWAFDYLGQSRYAEKIARYQEVFGPEQVRVFLFEDVKHQPAAVMAELCRFIGVDPAFDGYEFRVHNPSGRPRDGWLYRVLQGTHWIKTATRPFTSKALRRTVYARLKWYVDKRHAFEEKPHMLEATERRLYETFRDDVLALQPLLDRDLSAWLQPLGSADVAYASTSS